MKTKTNKTLRLARETVRNLAGADLARVVGGALLQARGVTMTCPSVDYCPSLDVACDKLVIK